MLKFFKDQVKGTGLEKILGPVYIYGKYVANQGYGFDYQLSPGVEMMTPAEWAGVDHEQTGEFFGYYDKTPWSPDMTSFLTHTIRDDNSVDIVIYNQKSSSRNVVADTSAWNYQQGAMAQWVEPDAVIYNDIVDNKLQSIIIDAQDNQLEKYPVPVQSVSPDGEQFLSINYRKFDRVNPQYGYGIAVENFDEKMSYNKDGIWRFDRSADDLDLIFTLEDLIEYDTETSMKHSDHWINHVMYSPDGTRFVFMHRWGGKDGKSSRLYVADVDGTNLELIMDSEVISHYSWLDNETLILWGQTQQWGGKYYVVDVETGYLNVIEGGLTEYGDGHPTVSRATDWLVTDTYANDAQIRHLLIHNLAESHTVEVGKFHSSLQLRGVKSCDLHPRWSPDDWLISVDSSHQGSRSTHILDVEKITNT